MISKSCVAAHLETKNDPNFLCGFRVESFVTAERQRTASVDLPTLEFDSDYLSEESSLDSLQLQFKEKATRGEGVCFDLEAKEKAYFDQLMGELDGCANFDELERVMGVLRKICRNFTNKTTFNPPTTQAAKDASFMQLKAELHSQAPARLQQVIHRFSDVNLSSPPTRNQKWGGVDCKIIIETGRLGINVYDTPLNDPAYGVYSVTFNHFSGSSNAEKQAAGRLHMGMVLTHVNGVDQRGLAPTVVLNGLKRRPCVLIFTKQTYAPKVKSEPTEGEAFIQPGGGEWRRAKLQQIDVGGFGAGDVTSEFLNTQPNMPFRDPSAPQLFTTAHPAPLPRLGSSLTKAYEWIQNNSSASASRLLLGVDIGNSSRSSRSSRSSSCCPPPKKLEPEAEPLPEPFPHHGDCCYCAQCRQQKPSQQTMTNSWKRARGKSTDNLAALDVAGDIAADIFGEPPQDGRTLLGEGRRVRSNSDPEQAATQIVV
jgi:hypothetical protein